MFNAMIEVLKANPRKIVFTEGHDARILEATARLVADGFLPPVLVGNVEEVKANAAKGGFNIEGVEILDPATYPSRTTQRRRFPSWKSISARRPRLLLLSLWRRIIFARLN